MLRLVGPSTLVRTSRILAACNGHYPNVLLRRPFVCRFHIRKPGTGVVKDDVLFHQTRLQSNDRIDKTVKCFRHTELSDLMLDLATVVSMFIHEAPEAQDACFGGAALYVAGNPKIFQMPRLRLHERVCSILRAHDDAKPSLTVAGPCFPSRPSGLGTEGLEAYRGASHHH
jgi:hypothetical protein